MLTMGTAHASTLGLGPRTAQAGYAQYGNEMVQPRVLPNTERCMRNIGHLRVPSIDGLASHTLIAARALRW